MKNIPVSTETQSNEGYQVLLIIKIKKICNNHDTKLKRMSSTMWVFKWRLSMMHWFSMMVHKLY
jgi:hypothetical protein